MPYRTPMSSGKIWMRTSIRIFLASLKPVRKQSHCEVFVSSVHPLGKGTVFERLILANASALGKISHAFWYNSTEVVMDRLFLPWLYKICVPRLLQTKVLPPSPYLY